jgi:hypothetical protein
MSETFCFEPLTRAFQKQFNAEGIKGLMGRSDRRPRAKVFAIGFRITGLPEPGTRANRFQLEFSYHSEPRDVRA